MLTALKTAEAGFVPSKHRALVRKVARQILPFGNAELAAADFLILFEEDTVFSAKQPSAVLTESGGLFVAAKKSSLYLTSPGYYR